MRKTYQQARERGANLELRKGYHYSLKEGQSPIYLLKIVPPFSPLVIVLQSAERRQLAHKGSISRYPFPLKLGEWREAEPLPGFWMNARDLCPIICYGFAHTRGAIRASPTKLTPNSIDFPL